MKYSYAFFFMSTWYRPAPMLSRVCPPGHRCARTHPCLGEVGPVQLPTERGWDTSIPPAVYPCAFPGSRGSEGFPPEPFVGRQCAVPHTGWVLFLPNFICTSRKIFFLPAHHLSLPSRGAANLRFLPLCCPGVAGQVGEGVAFALPWASRCLVLRCLPMSTGFPRCTQSTERPVCKGESLPPGKTDVQFS